MDIGVWGDSITYGSRDADALGWVGRLRKARSPEKDGEVVYDRGICGDTSRGLLNRFSSELASFIYPLDVVIFAIGINDVVSRGESTECEVPLEEFKENIQKLIAQARESISLVYVVGLTNVDESRTVPFGGSKSGKQYRNAKIVTYNKVLEDMVNEMGASFVDVFGILKNADLADGLHPNSAGYEKLYIKISATIA